jgi:hypothetical protein
MKTLGRAFAIMVIVNAAAFFWMGRFLGDWDPLKLDSFIRALTEHWYGPGPTFWAAYVVGILLFETMMFLVALLCSKLAKGVFWSTVLGTVAVFGLVSLKVWDIQRNVAKFQRPAVQAVVIGSDQEKDAPKDVLPPVVDPTPQP